MTRGVMLDTSFLISLVDGNRAHHETAKHYYQHCLGENVPMFVSTIALSEFAIRQPVTDLPLRNIRPMTFTVPHAVKTAALNFSAHRDPNDRRDVVKDDFKILGQVAEEAIPLLLTEDAQTLYRYCERLRTDGKIQCRAIKLVDGFDVAWFAGGQGDMFTKQ